LLAAADGVLWTALERREVGATHAEVILHHLKRGTPAGRGRTSRALRNLMREIIQAVRERNLTALELQDRFKAGGVDCVLGSDPRRRNEDPENNLGDKTPAWRLSRKKRLIVRHRNLGLRMPASELRRLAQDYQKLAELLERWAEEPEEDAT
jgi:hypothetical protein